MFFMIGVSNAVKKLNFDQLEICKKCGKYGHVEVYVSYMYLMLFFIPIIKWNKQYYVKMSCCNRTGKISKELGQAIKKGEIMHLSIDTINFDDNENVEKRCYNCGYTTLENFEFCPKCGRKF